MSWGGGAAYRVLGGAYDGGGPGYGSFGIPAVADTLNASGAQTTTQENWSGFRIGTVPEPSSASMLLFGGIVFLARRKTSKNKI